tara:strand:- start:823 stop:1074 length:252 start_codon:yes stop_codon:yes gene_type:complete
MNITKICKECQVEKILECYTNNLTGKFKKSAKCKICMKQYNKKYCKKYYNKNKSDLIEKQKKYNEENKEKIKSYMQNYYKNNK